MSDTKSFKILIVDDNPANLMILDDMLFNQGYSVFIAKNGKQAITMAKEKMPDMILLDVSMPGMDGFEVCQELKSIPETSEILIIFVTAINDSNQIKRGLAMGAVDYILKPLDEEIVTSKIRNHLEQKVQKDIYQEGQINAKKQMVSQTKLFGSVTSDLVNILKQNEDSLEKLLLIDELSETVKNQIDQIRIQNRQVYEQLEKLGLRSKIINNEIVASNKKFDIDVVINHCVKFYSRLAKKNGLTLLYENPGEKIVYGDSSLITVVIKNLITNAIKFTANGGDIIINASKWDNDPNYTIITVYDTGVGIPPDKSAKLFDEQNILSDDTGKLGLGLGIASHFIKLCNGKIWVESMQGIGSDFKFILPNSLKI
ncbi:MAG: hybrid sensor histidine kinase/response regulator [Bacteroidales bacterium]|nr:hybrid sensor histidine kinase/response regulator [Bacteroidales bacterium]